MKLIDGRARLTAFERRKALSAAARFQVEWLEDRTLLSTSSITLANQLTDSPVTAMLTAAPADTTPPSVVSTAPADGATHVLTSTTVTATFSEAIQPGTMSFVLRDSKSTLIPSTVSYDAATFKATLTPNAPLTDGVSYTAIVSGAMDLAGNPMAGHTDWSFTVTPVGTGPFTIWQPSDLPGAVDDPDPTPSELGLKFQADTSGYISAIRFYKGPTNTGVHVADLWTSNGQLLATATFSSESSEGWQQVNFPQPVLIQANTTYVASYHTNVGHYAEDDDFFDSNGVDSGPLHALAAGIDGANGVFANGPAGTFPTDDFSSANYWVDVVFASSAPLGPMVTSTSPTQGMTDVSTNATISATFNESVQAGSISFTLRNSANNPVAGSFIYNDATHTVTFTPAASLAASSTYTAKVSGATDVDGVAMAAPFTWSFSTPTPALDPSVVGQWSNVINWPLVAINQVLLKDGRILMWDGGPDCIGSSSATVYNPADGSFTPVPVPNPDETNDIFCSGQTVLPDGRVVVVGGHDCTGVNLGSTHINIFNPATMTWTQGPDMAYARWYPTATLLSDGRVLITAGSDTSNTTYVPIPEVYDPASNTVTQLTQAELTVPNYPFIFVLPNGNVLEAGSDEANFPTQILNVATQTWTMLDPNPVDGGTAVMYLPGKVLKTGSSYHSDTSEFDSDPSAATAYVLDTTQAHPTWQQTASMAYGRANHNMTILPDGSVLVTGGDNTLGGFDPATAVYAAELWSPTSKTFSTMASAAVPRMYHSTAILLPDGRVLSAGGGRNYVNEDDYLDAQYYSPPYLFKGSRPTITSSPASLSYGSNVFVGTPDGAQITSVALVATGAVTHEVNMNQRYVPLTFTQTAGGLTVHTPASVNLAPPGSYMLFIVNSNGVPSIAPIANLSTAPAGAVLTRALFYKGSPRFDASGDDAAIATDKLALLPGQTASFANYSSYTRGINGIIVDIAGVSGAITSSDFAVRVGNNNTPSSWPAGPAPTVSVRSGQGVNGSTRIELTWADGAIAGTWAQVTVLADGNTGLSSNDVFYFGNAIGDTGDSTGDAMVTANDENAARANTANLVMNPAPITNRYDFNRDGKVDAQDEIIARIHITNGSTALNLISAPASFNLLPAAAIPAESSASVINSGSNLIGTSPSLPSGALTVSVTSLAVPAVTTPPASLVTGPAGTTSTPQSLITPDSTYSDSIRKFVWKLFRKKLVNGRPLRPMNLSESKLV